jgi:hypothetical protein
MRNPPSFWLLVVVALLAMCGTAAAKADPVMTVARPACPVVKAGFGRCLTVWQALADQRPVELADMALAGIGR